MNEKLINSLRQFGLTVYEARVYSVLVSRGVAKAREIAEEARIPYSKIYFVLNDLESKGWVEIQRGKPSLYKPIPPHDAIESSKEVVLQRLKDAEAGALKSLERLYAGQEEARKGELWSVRGTRNVLRRIEEMLAQAEREVWIGVTVNRRDIVKSLEKLLAETVRMFKMRKIDVKVLALAEKVETVAECLGELSTSAEVRWRQKAEELSGMGVVVDDEQALLNFGYQEELSATWTDEKGFVLMLKGVIKSMWLQAKALS